MACLQVLSASRPSLELGAYSGVCAVSGVTQLAPFLFLTVQPLFQAGVLVLSHIQVCWVIPCVTGSGLPIGALWPDLVLPVKSVCLPLVEDAELTLGLGAVSRRSDVMVRGMHPLAASDWPDGWFQFAVLDSNACLA